MSASVVWQRRVVSIWRPSCDRRSLRRGAKLLVHRYEADGQPARQRMVNRSVREVSMLLVEPLSGRRRHQLDRPESGPDGLRFAASENRAPDPATCVRRVDEESPDLGGIRLRVEAGLVPPGVRVAAEQCAPPAPAATSDDLPRARFGDEGWGIANEGCIDAEGTLQCGIDLRRRVVPGPDSASRPRDQLM